MLSLEEFQSVFQRFGVPNKFTESPKNFPSGFKTIDSFKPSTRSNLRVVLEIAIANERNFDYLRELSKKVKNQMFDWLDSDLKGFATLEDFGDLLSEGGDFLVTHRELAHLISRFDLRVDGRITFGEFAAEMTAKPFNCPRRKRQNDALESS